MRKKSDSKRSAEEKEVLGEEEEAAQETLREEDELADQLESAFAQRSAAAQNVWKAGGPAKDAAIRQLIQTFASMVESFPKEDAIPDHKGRYRPEDLEFRKLLDANKQIVKAKRVLLKSENFDSRDFTIFIAGKKWAKNVLAPLLALCEKDDTPLAMSICSLCLVLVKKISDKTNKELLVAQKKIRQRKSVHDDLSLELALVRNYEEQVHALLSFKEALCHEKCNAAITNAFREFWLQERVFESNRVSLTERESERESKLGVAVCLSFVRRVLAISAPSQWCSPSEMLTHRSVHHQYIVHFRVLLSVLPGIVSDLQRSYHDDWLTDVLLIIHYVLQSFEAEDLFFVWKSGGILPNFSSLLEDESESSESSQTPSGTLSSPSHAQTHTGSVAVPVALAQRARTATQAPGLLSSLLNSEKQRRTQAQTALSASSALRGNRTFSLALKNVPQITTSALSSSSNPAQIQEDPLLAELGVPSAKEREAASAASNANSAKKAPLHVHTTGTNTAVSALLLKDPFAVRGDALPQAKTKRNKKHVGFRVDNPLTSPSSLRESAALSLGTHSAVSQQACVVAASLCDALCTDVCLKALVRRANEDLRRDELRISPEIETMYLHSLAALLRYNRLKVEHLRTQQSTQHTNTKTERERQEEETSEKEVNTVSEWKPNLLNVVDALDRLSFSRVTHALQRLSVSSKDTPQEILSSQIIHPLMLYTEMLHYLRIMCDSSVSGHHELAVGILYRLFYVGYNERQDPLPRLISQWEAGEFSKAHCVQLVECVHTTLRTLERARERVREREKEGSVNVSESERKKDKTAKKELDLEHYLVSALRFEVEDYVRRLCVPHTLSLYVCVLREVRENPLWVNERVFLFLQRLCNTRIHSDALDAAQSELFAPLSTQTQSLSDTQNSSHNALAQSQAISGGAHLGHLLFSLSTFLVFHQILTDDNNKLIPEANRPLICLIRTIIRQFGEISSQNRMLAVEALFTHARPHDAILSWNSVYDSHSFARARWASERSGSAASLNALTQRQHGDSESESGSESENDEESVSGSDDNEDPKRQGSDEEEEFDEDAMKVALERARERKRAREKDQQAQKKSKKRSLDKDGKKKKKRKRSTHSDSERESERDSEGEEEVVRERSERMRARSAVHVWSEEEDAVLRRLYTLYKGSRSVFVSIAQSDEIRAFNTQRTPDQIAKRVTELQLPETETDSHEQSQSASQTPDHALSQQAPTDADLFSQTQTQSIALSQSTERDRTSSFSLQDSEAKTDKNSGKSSGKLLRRGRARALSDDDDDELFDKEEDALTQTLAETEPQVVLNMSQRAQLNLDSDDDL